MESSRAAQWICIFLVGALFQECDTSRNIVNPAKNYFVKYYGGQGIQTGVDIVVKPDGTFILLGNTKKPGQSNFQIYLVHADALGNVLKEQTLGDSLLDTQGKDIELTSTGIVVTGNVSSSTTPGTHDIFLATLDATSLAILGGPITKGFPKVMTAGGGEADDNVSSVTPLADGGFIVTGYSDHIDPTTTDSIKDLHDAIHARFDAQLTFYSSVWNPFHGGPVGTYGTKVFQNGTNHFYFFGSSTQGKPGDKTKDNLNFLVYELNAGGEVSGAIAQPGLDGTDERLGSVCQSGDIFYLGGTSTASSSNQLFVSQFIINSLDSGLTPGFGDKTVGSDLGNLTIQQTSCSAANGSGWFLLANEATTGNSNLYLTKLNSTNTTLWGSPVIYGGAQNDFLGAVAELPDGKLLIIGTMAVGQDGGTKMVLMKVNGNGQFSD